MTPSRVATVLIFQENAGPFVVGAAAGAEGEDDRDDQDTQRVQSREIPSGRGIGSLASLLEEAVYHVQHVRLGHTTGASEAAAS